MNEENNNTGSLSGGLKRQADVFNAGKDSRCRAQGGITSLEGLTRWTFDRGMTAEVDSDGQWYKVSDIEYRLATTAASAVPAETLADDDRYQYVRDLLLEVMRTTHGINTVRISDVLDILSEIAAAPSAALSEKAEPDGVRDAARYRFLRDRLAVEDLPSEHPAWSSPSEIESIKVDNEVDARIRALKSATTKDQAASKGGDTNG